MSAKLVKKIKFITILLAELILIYKFQQNEVGKYGIVNFTPIPENIFFRSRIPFKSCLCYYLSFMMYATSRRNSPYIFVEPLGWNRTCNKENFYVRRVFGNSFKKARLWDKKLYNSTMFCTKFLPKYGFSAVNDSQHSLGIFRAKYFRAKQFYNEKEEGLLHENN